MINCQETFLGLANAPHSVPPRLTVEDQLGDRLRSKISTDLGIRRCLPPRIGPNGSWDTTKITIHDLSFGERIGHLQH